MARIKLAYIGGGSTRAAGTMASFMHQGENFQGSEVVLMDLDQDRLGVVRTLATKMARARGLDIQVSATTDRRDALRDCDAVLTSYRPGGFEARHLDESIPLRHGVIGQETQGPGGFFMALRSIHVMMGIIADMEAVCPNAILFNYTNPVNIVSEAVTHHTDITAYSFCEGPIQFNAEYAAVIGLDPDKLDAVSIGLNHGSWTIRHRYEGQDFIPILRSAYERMVDGGAEPRARLGMLELACVMGSLPSRYLRNYYFRDDVVAEQLAQPMTRARTILAQMDDYWAHYRDQAARDDPKLDPGRSRGGIHELELAIDVMDAIFNDRREVWYANLPNHGSIADLPDDLVVETTAYADRGGLVPLAHGPLPRPVSGLIKMLAEYQALTARAAVCGTRREGIQALASNPLVPSLPLATAIYDEMAAAHRAYLPGRLLR